MSGFSTDIIPVSFAVIHLSLIFVLISQYMLHCVIMQTFLKIFWSQQISKKFLGQNKEELNMMMMIKDIVQSVGAAVVFSP